MPGELHSFSDSEPLSNAVADHVADGVGGCVRVGGAPQRLQRLGQALQPLLGAARSLGEVQREEGTAPTAAKTRTIVPVTLG